MRRPLLVTLVMVLSLVLLCVQRYNLAAQAAPDEYFGDLVLDNDNVTVIEGQFDIAGSIIVAENATLILRNATVNIVQIGDWEHSIILRNSTAADNPRLEITNSTLTSAYKYSLKLYENSTATVQDSNLTASQAGSYCWVSLYDYSHAIFVNVKLHGLSRMANLPRSLYDWVHVEVSDSFIDILNVYEWAYASIWNCSILASNSYGNFSSIIMSISEVASIQSFDSSQQVLADSGVGSVFACNKTWIRLFNSTYSSYTMCDQAHMDINWWLNIRVIDHNSQNVSWAKIEVRYPNSTLAWPAYTEPDGCTKTTLLEMTMNATGAYSIGDYLVIATYDDVYSNQTTVAMTGNQQIIIILDELIVPEFQSSTLLVFMVAMLLSAVSCRRNCGFQIKKDPGMSQQRY